MKGEAVPPAHHIVRYVGGQHIDKDLDSQPVILGGGLIARPHDGNSPSCNWLECLRGSVDEQVQKVRMQRV